MKSEKTKLFLNNIKDYLKEKEINKNLLKLNVYDDFDRLVNQNDTEGLKKYLKKITKEKHLILSKYLMEKPSELLIPVALKAFSEQKINVLKFPISVDSMVPIYLLPVINPNYVNSLEYFTDNFVGKKIIRRPGEKNDLEMLNFLNRPTINLIKPSITFEYLNIFDNKSALAYLSRFEFFFNHPKDCFSKDLVKKIEYDFHKENSHKTIQSADFHPFIIDDLKKAFKNLKPLEKMEVLKNLKNNFRFDEIVDQWFNLPAPNPTNFYKKYCANLINSECPDLGKVKVKKGVYNSAVLNFEEMNLEIERQSLKLGLVDNVQKKLIVL